MEKKWKKGDGFFQVDTSGMTDKEAQEFVDKFCKRLDDGVLVVNQKVKWVD